MKRPPPTHPQPKRRRPPARSGGGWGPLRRAPVQHLDMRGRPGLLRTTLEAQETRGLTRSDDLSRLLPSEVHCGVLTCGMGGRVLTCGMLMCSSCCLATGVPHVPVPLHVQCPPLSTAC